MYRSLSGKNCMSARDSFPLIGITKLNGMCTNSHAVFVLACQPLQPVIEKFDTHWFYAITLTVCL